MQPFARQSTWQLQSASIFEICLCGLFGTNSNAHNERLLPVQSESWFRTSKTDSHRRSWCICGSDGRWCSRSARCRRLAVTSIFEWRLFWFQIGFSELFSVVFFGRSPCILGTADSGPWGFIASVFIALLCWVCCRNGAECECFDCSSVSGRYRASFCRLCLWFSWVPPCTFSSDSKSILTWGYCQYK